MAATVFIRPTAGVVIANVAQIRSGVQMMTRRVRVDATGHTSFVAYAKKTKGARKKFTAYVLKAKEIAWKRNQDWFVN